MVGIDLGKKTTGIAISEGKLAHPYTTITHASTKEAVEKVAEIVKIENGQKVVIGTVEGKIAKMFANFASRLKKKMPNIDIILQDETLTSRQAQDTMIKLGIGKFRRRKKEHEIAAAIILQSYLQSND